MRLFMMCLMVIRDMGVHDITSLTLLTVYLSHERTRYVLNHLVLSPLGMSITPHPRRNMTGHMADLAVSFG